MAKVALGYDVWRDETLVEHARNGDREAFRAIMQRFNQRLFRVARAILGADTEAEDALQDAYLRAFQAIDRFRGDSSLLTWLTAITVNEARGRLRKGKTAAALAGDTSAEVLLFPGVAMPIDPEAEAARAEARRLLESAVDALPEDFRVVFVLRAVQGCSVEETAEQLGLNPQTVKTRLHRARRLLRRGLEAALIDGMAGLYPFLGERCARISERVLTRLSQQRSER
jgi:RNA polymerase sigma-70 factor (ECF subfamily)